MTDQEIALDAINRSLAELKRIPVTWFSTQFGAYTAFEVAVRALQDLRKVAHRGGP